MMRRLLVMSLLSLFVSPCSLPKKSSLGEEAPVIDVDQKRSNDKRNLRALKLANEMEVLLISDPTMNKSAAAIDVKVGSLEDAPEHLGIAHFLEHMLFLGTEKYPDVDEYNRFLSSHQGHSNAYTDEEDTNYYFEVGHEGFEGAIDRFAQFFIAPLFTPEYVERELNAVHSEHQKNLQNDDWRIHRVFQHLYKKGHPRQKFATGSLETLKDTSRETLIEFYRKNYSANQMKLVLMSNRPLDEMEALAKTFSMIKNSQLKPRVYDSQIFDPADLPRIIRIKPVKDLKKLELVFATPSKYPYWQSKPGSTLSHLIGYEGQGSLLSLLKKENLATKLGSGLDSSSYAGTFSIDVELTDKGEEQRERVIDLIFSYIQVLKKEGLKPYIYDERKNMADVEFVYREPREGGHVASDYASRMQLHPALAIEKNDSLFHKYSPEEFNYFLSFLTPKNLNIFYISQKEKTNAIEPYYGTEYSNEKIPDQTISRWEQAPQHEALTLPKANEFIPHKLEVLSVASEVKPYKILDNDWGVFWFQDDDAFLLPKAHVRINLLNLKVNDKPHDKLMSLLYVAAINEGLNEWAYDIGLAGLNFSILRLDTGIQIEFGGYADNLPRLMEEVVSKLKTITIDEPTFASIKEELKRNITNSALDAAYQQLMYEMKYLTQKNVIHYHSFFNPLEKQGIDLISPVTLDQVKNYASTLFSEIAIEGIGYGSIKTQKITEALNSLPSKLGSKVLPLNKRPQNESFIFNKGKPLAKLMFTQTNNNCWGQSLQFGKRDQRLNAILRVGHSFLQTSFFTHLRTKQQLGYIVHSGLNFQEKVLGLTFLVQSATHSPVDIAKRAQTWMSDALEELKNLSQNEFEVYKKAVIQELKEKDKTMYDRLQTLGFEALVMKGMFKYKDETALATESITKADVFEVFQEAFDEHKRAGLSIYLSTDKTLKPKLAEMLIKDEDKFKQSTEVYQ